MGTIIETKVLLSLANENKEINAHVAKIHQAFVDLTNQDPRNLIKYFLKGVVKEDKLSGQIRIVETGVEKLLVHARFPGQEGPIDFWLIVPRYDFNNNEETEKTLLPKINDKMDEIWANKDNIQYNIPVMYTSLESAKKAFGRMDTNIEKLKSYTVYDKLFGYLRAMKVSLDKPLSNDEILKILGTWRWNKDSVAEYRNIMTGMIYGWTNDLKNYSTATVLKIIYTHTAGTAIAYIIKNSNIEEILNAG